MKARSHTLYVLIAAVLGLALFAVLDPNPGRSVHGDGYYTWLWARTMVMDGDLDFHDDYLVCNDPWALGDSPVGRDLNYWNLGPALFWAPILAYDVATGHESLQATDPIERTACRDGAMAHVRCRVRGETATGGGRLRHNVRRGHAGGNRAVRDHQGGSGGVAEEDVSGPPTDSVGATRTDCISGGAVHPP